MIEKNCTITVSELVEYPPNSLFVVMNEVQKPVINKIKNLVEYVMLFDLSLYKRNLKMMAQQKDRILKAHESSYQKQLEIYSVTDSVETDVKKVTDIMRAFND